MLARAFLHTTVVLWMTGLTLQGVSLSALSVAPDQLVVPVLRAVVRVGLGVVLSQLSQRGFDAKMMAFIWPAMQKKAFMSLRVKARRGRAGRRGGGGGGGGGWSRRKAKSDSGWLQPTRGAGGRGYGAKPGKGAAGVGLVPGWACRWASGSATEWACTHAAKRGVHGNGYGVQPGFGAVAGVGYAGVHPGLGAQYYPGQAKGPKPGKDFRS
ncbi:hypothetical protein CRUP_008508 [Coryphaenoides rupestris]|nr:hypothetical protein CRUP_008508 [Coryphaenoides rupestris]